MIHKIFGDLKKLFKHTNYSKLFIANVISRFGDSIDVVAYSWMVYILTGSKLLLGTIYAVNVLPNIILSPFAGAFVEYSSKRKIILLGDLLRGLIVCITSFLFFTNNLHTWHLFVLTFLTSSIEVFVSPAKFSVLAKLIPKELYLQANSTAASIAQLAQLIGIACAGSIIALMGVHGAFLVDAATFFLSFIIIYSVNFPHQETKPFTKSNYFDNLKEGYNFVHKQKIMLNIMFYAAIANLLFTPINALLPVYAKEVLNKGASAISLISGSFMIGSILGGIIIGQIGKKINMITLITFAGVFIGIFYSLLSIPSFLGFINPVSIAIIASLLMGILFPFINANIGTYIMSNTPENMMSRVGGILGMLCMIANPVGACLSGIVCNYISIKTLFMINGLIFISITIVIFNKKVFKPLKSNDKLVESNTLAN